MDSRVLSSGYFESTVEIVSLQVTYEPHTIFCRCRKETPPADGGQRSAGSSNQMAVFKCIETFVNSVS